MAAANSDVTRARADRAIPGGNQIMIIIWLNAFRPANWNANPPPGYSGPNKSCHDTELDTARWGSTAN